MKSAKNMWNWAVSAVVALGLVAGLMAVTAKADDAASGKGTIAGTVLDKDGKAVAGAEVLLMKVAERGQGKAEGKKDAAGKAERKAKNQAEGAAKPEKKKAEPVATATTDSDGKFAMKDVAAGTYQVRTRVKGSGAANEKVTLAAGQTAEVKLQLAQGGAKKEPGAKKERGEKKNKKQQ